MKLGWYLNRLRAMSIAEIAHRLRAAAQSKLEQAGVGLAAPVPGTSRYGLPWTDRLPDDLASDAYENAANEILAGRFHVFSMRPAEIGFPPSWNKDPLTGVHAPLTFGKAIDYRAEDVVGNIKYLWEPNRHLELVTLAQAWRLTSRAEFVSGCRELLDSWFEQCPYPLGINWTSSLELGIRLLNWSVAWQLLGGNDSPLFGKSSGAAFKGRWLGSVYRHLHFIRRHLSRHSSANNHLLGELAGLVVGGTTWPLWDDVKQWLSDSHAEFERQALLQNGSDGVNREQATWYHHEVADMMLLAGLVCRANGMDFSRDYWARLEAMLEFIAGIMDVKGGVPSIGDSDDAVIVRFHPQQNAFVYRSLLATGAVLFSRPELGKKARVLDDKSKWLLGSDAPRRFEQLSLDSEDSAPKREFPVAGYYVLGSDFDRETEVRIVADAGPLGYLSIAAHGHADALALTLTIAGWPILIDPGTYAYHTERKWREYFRGTAAHNTVRVDGVDQSVSGGNFLWIEHADAECLAYETTDERDRLVGRHGGYLRLQDPVEHIREVIWNRIDRTVLIRDRLSCRRPHSIEIFWHFDAEADVQPEDGHALVRRGPSQLRIEWKKGTAFELVRGRDTPPLGWTSHRFGEKHPSPTLVLSQRVEGSTTLETRIAVQRPDGDPGTDR